MAADCLSTVPDDLLQCFVSFGGRRGDGGRRNKRRHGAGLRRLTLFLNGGTNPHSGMFDGDGLYGGDDGVLLLGDPAAAAQKGLRVQREDHDRRLYRAWLASLQPCAATLRELELAFCSLEQPWTTTAPGSLAFPRLTDLRLRSCAVSEGYLQVVVDAAPALTSLVLVDVSYKSPQDYLMTRRLPLNRRSRLKHMHSYRSLRLRLRCLTLTDLVIEPNYTCSRLEASCNCGSATGIELDVPSLCSFRYRGYPVKLSLASPPPWLEHVDLDVRRRDREIDVGVSRYRRFGMDLDKYEPTSRMLANFSTTRALKLRLDCIEDIVAGEKAHDGGAPILPTFPNLDLLELDGQCRHTSSDEEAAMARLLRCCPAMSELRLRLNMRDVYDYDWDDDYDTFDKDRVTGSYNNSMDRFKKLASMSSTHRQGAIGAGFCQISELAALMSNKCAFSCLLTSLRKVTLQFKAKEANSFQVRLAKFLVENAMVLEEMHVDDGTQLFSDHLYNNVARWRADAFKRRNLKDTAEFQVYQLANPVEDPDERIDYE